MRMLSRPSLMPKCSSANRRSRGLMSRRGSESRAHGGWSRRLVGHHEAQNASDRGLQLAPLDDQIQHAAFEQKLTALKAVGKLLPDRLFDDPRTGKADQ